MSSQLPGEDKASCSSQFQRGMANKTLLTSVRMEWESTRNHTPPAPHLGSKQARAAPIGFANLITHADCAVIDCDASGIIAVELDSSLGLDGGGLVRIS